MSTIFLTGGNGFIGSNLIPKLLSKGYNIYALTRYISNRTPSYPREVKVVYGDLRDSLVLQKLIREIYPEYVIHLGAISPVAQSFNHSQEVIETNFLGTVNLAHANLTNPNLKRFIMAGTSEEYGNQETFPIKEDAPKNCNQPYAISKVAADNYLHYLFEGFDFPICVAKPFNSYGRINNFNFVTEKVITQMLKSKTIILGNPDPVRDLMYVDDHVEGYIKILESKVCPTAVNLCTGIGTTIKELAELIKDLLGWNGEIIWNRSFKRPTEIDKLLGDNTLAKETLGWEPKYDLEEGLLLTLEKISKVIC